MGHLKKKKGKKKEKYLARIKDFKDEKRYMKLYYEFKAILRFHCFLKIRFSKIFKELFD